MSDRMTSTCHHCDQPILDTSGVDPNVPWVHEHSGNARCDVFTPADAVRLAGTAGTFAEPGAAK